MTDIVEQAIQEMWYDDDGELKDEFADWLENTTLAHSIGDLMNQPRRIAFIKYNNLDLSTTEMREWSLNIQCVVHRPHVLRQKAALSTGIMDILIVAIGLLLLPFLIPLSIIYTLLSKAIDYLKTMRRYINDLP